MSLALDVKETLLTRLEEQFKLHSDRPAVKTESTSWSYRELDVISANCARSLQDKCQSAFAPVVVLMKHDGPLVAAIIGVLRSGGFYLALNPASPARRLQQIVQETRPRAIIADAEHQELARELVGSKTQRFLIDELLTGRGCVSMASVSPGDPCALFYTSGSSQRPRPVVYRYGATWQSVTNHARLLHITTEDRLTLLSPCSAAASVSATLGALLNGACLFPFQPVREGLHRMEDWIRKNRITVYHSVPSLFRRFAQILAPGEMLPAVRAVKLGGETVFPADVELFREHFPPGAVLVNGLGLTEANGNICHFRMTHETRITTLTVPIGKPNEGVEIKLVDRGSEEVASGEIGEIAVRGKQISPAYWTGSAVEQHLIDSEGWFRTGDLARRDPEGALEYLGRKDGQVKLHGQWICIAEIEAILARIPGVRNAAVVPVDISGEEKKIIAFLSWNKGALSKQELRSAVSRQLPSYSIPNRFVSLEQLPTLPNGKVDRLGLSQQATQALATKTKPQADPSDFVRLQLIRIWRKVLQNNSIGVADDFFISGGDSLAAATMLAAVDTHFGINLSASVLLEAPTIEMLAQIIRRGRWLESGMSLVALRSSGTKSALYCVPGAGAEPLEFRRLAAHLGDDQPIFAFQPQGLDGREPFHTSVGEMAAYYLASLRRHQSRGPYFLCGQSFGGVVAFDMAKRLIENGDEVGFLGLLDSYAGEYPRVRKNLSRKKRLTLKIRNLDGCQNGVTIRSLGRGVKMRIKHHLIKLYLRLNFRSETMRRHHWRFLYHEACVAARRRHKLEPLPLKIHLFRVEDQPSAEFFEQDELLGWRGMAGKGIEVHKLRGDHGRLLHEPNVATLSHQLRAYLK